jgi:hypothetical protein
MRISMVLLAVATGVLFAACHPAQSRNMGVAVPGFPIPQLQLPVDAVLFEFPQDQSLADMERAGRALVLRDQSGSVWMLRFETQSSWPEIIRCVQDSLEALGYEYYSNDQFLPMPDPQSKQNDFVMLWSNSAAKDTATLISVTLKNEMLTAKQQGSPDPASVPPPYNQPPYNKLMYSLIVSVATLPAIAK